MGFIALFGAAVGAVLVMFIALAVLPAVVGITNATGGIAGTGLVPQLFEYAAGVVFIACVAYGAFVLLFQGG